MNRHIKKDVEETIWIRLLLIFITLLLVAVVLLLRIFDLQIVNGEKTLNDFTLKIQKERYIPSTRGNIYDRNGKVLAHNELAYTVTIKDVYETGSQKNERLNETLCKLIAIIEGNGDKVNNEFNIIINEDGEFAFNVEGKALRRFRADIYGKADPGDMDYGEETASPDDIIEYLSSYGRYGIGKSADINNPRDSFTMWEGFTKKQVLQLVTIRYAMSANSYQKFIPTTIASNVSEKTVASVLENSEELLGAEIAEDTVRVYEDSMYFSQILGYTGKISQEELIELNGPLEDSKTVNKNHGEYMRNDMIGKAGIEQAMETYLQGIKGKETVFVDNLGKIIEVKNRSEPIAGNDLYLSLDADLQKAVYNILEQKLAGILVSKIINVKNYVIPEHPSATTLKIPIDDVYFALINNSIIDISHFDDADAKPNEQAIYQSFLSKQEQTFKELDDQFYIKNMPYNKLSTEYQNYQSYIVSMLSENNILLSKEIDPEDETYIAWRKDETISLGDFLKYCIASNWIDVSKLDLKNQYADSDEVFDTLVKFIYKKLENNTSFGKKLYQYMIKADRITGKQICMVLLEQDVISITEDEKDKFSSGAISAYNFMIFLIENLFITPAQLALDPYSGSVVITNVEGETLALVTYPSYDNNRLANSIDAEYYARLQTDLSRPMWNYATQQKTAPGSTFKVVSATAGLNEGIITTTSTFMCRGIYDRFTNNQYKCWIYPSAHGTLNVSGGIANSCNSFFYEVGYQLGLNGEEYSSDLGIQKLAEYADWYGLTEKSGVEIEESAPEVSDNYSVLSAIGQGNNNFTTIGLARYVTTLANNGTCYNLTLLDKVTDANGNLLVNFEPEIRNQIDMPLSYWNAIHSGMRQVVEKRSDYQVLDVAGIRIAGKTGTAQENLKRANHALFISYGPYEKPEIAIATRVAFGYSSNYAANITRDIYKYYFEVEDEDSILTGTAEVPDATTVGGD